MIGIRSPAPPVEPPSAATRAGPRARCPGLHGSIPALVTPFRPNPGRPDPGRPDPGRGDDGAVDAAALSSLVRRLVERGATALVACGSTGEAAALTARERARVLRVVLEAAGPGTPVIAGIGAPCTRDAVALARAAERGGASALLCAAPPYCKPDQEGLRAHVRAVAAATGLPLVLYDVPSRAGVGFGDETIARLRDDGAIDALKDATGDLGRPPRLRRLLGAELPQLSGDDATAAGHLAMGGAGCVSVTAVVAPAACAALQRAWAAGDAPRFAALRDCLAPLHDALFVETNPVPVKAALALLGLCAAAPRLPLLRARDTTAALLAGVLADVSPIEEAAARPPARRAA